jgi:Glutamate synthase domain 2
VDGCRGGCEIWLSSFRGREVLYPIGFGEITAGADKNYPIDYSHLSIQGFAVGAKGLPKGVVPGPDTALFPVVDTEMEYGWTKKVKMKMPIFTGALGSTEIARRNWEHFAAGAAISGITMSAVRMSVALIPLWNWTRMVKSRNLLRWIAG